MPTRTRRTRRSTPLGEYKRKRDFTKTGEPRGQAARRKSSRALHFVIQKHAASRLHFDLRLELDGVMKSWAVPKGPSYDPAVRRLAMEVEDHPLEYNTFEGSIPKGEYGGGSVMLWDRGTYEPEGGGGAEALRDGYERGDLKVVLHGKRLIGGWVLVRMRRDDSDRAQWLLIKHRDETADAKYDVVADEMTSVVTGRTMEEIGAKAKRVQAKRVQAKRVQAKRVQAKRVQAKRAPAKKRSKTPARKKRSTRTSR